MKFLLEHMLPKKVRYAKVYLEAGSASVYFSLNGTDADWHASIGKRRRDLELTDREYARLRGALPAVEMLDNDGRIVTLRNAAGFDEQWKKPQWVLKRVHGRNDRDQ